MRKGIDCMGRAWEEIPLRGKMIDITNQCFGKLTTLFPVNIGKIGTSYWLCKCQCGNLIVCDGASLRNNHTKSCGCYKIEKIKQRSEDARQLMIGKKSGKLTVISFDSYKTNANGEQNAYYWCQCDCGSPLISVSGRKINDKHTKSCGCLHQESMCKLNAKNIEGVRFGKLVACNPTDMRDASGGIIWECKCDCGNTHYASINLLQHGDTKSCGCLKSIGEFNIMTILNSCHIIYIHDRPYFDDLINDDGNKLRYDFILLNEYRIPYRIIEFDGMQHDEPIDFFGGEDSFMKLQRNDEIKNQYALSHNIPLVRIPYSKRDSMTFDDLFGDKYLIKGEM